ncbi:hypothetical protein QP096_01480 [Alloscardovia omnicolens]|uniref:diacylglycerol/lipid kinase family protein n=2 Tax=Alloscardovia omnicolens TaxID=419015 RepID=UPI002550E45D|nr:hypothetical protein [Alloscardovia omnicolens]MDK6250684.1 hypothetical protein [Alloscardovia omnicolens]
MFDDQGRALDIAAKQWHFNNAAGIGFDADVCVKVLHSDVSDRLSRLHLSQLAYLCAALPGFFKHRGFSVSVDIDGEVCRYDDTLFVAVMNEPYEGGGFKFCPQASPYDGQLDSCIAQGIKKTELVHLIPRVMKGHHTSSRGVHMARGRVYRITTNVPVWVQTDGEVAYKSNDISISLLPQAVQFLGL